MLIGGGVAVFSFLIHALSAVVPWPAGVSGRPPEPQRSPPHTRSVISSLTSIATALARSGGRADRRGKGGCPWSVFDGPQAGQPAGPRPAQTPQAVPRREPDERFAWPSVDGEAAASQPATCGR